MSWASKLQATVALSTTEAEYMAAAAAAQEAVHLRQLLGDISMRQQGPTTIYEDNQGCIALSSNPGYHGRSKDIDIRYHFVREKVESQEIKLEYITTQDQLADLLTKPLVKAKFEPLMRKVLGYEA